MGVEGQDVDLRALYEAKARAELAEADRLAPGSDAIAFSGALVPDVALVKGLPGPAESSGGAAMTGTDGDALRKALAALGHDPDLAFFTLSRPDAAIDGQARARRLRAQLEAVDAPLVIALDAESASDVADAFGLGELPFGSVMRGSGRRFVAVDGFEASLADERAKKRVWEQLRVAIPSEPVF